MVYVSPAYEKLWESSCEELYKTPRAFIDKIHPEDRDQYIKTVEKYHAESRPYQVRFRIVMNDGSFRWIYESGYPSISPHEVESLMTGTCIDITSQVIIDEELKKAKSILEHAEEIGLAGSFEMDPETGYLYLSVGWKRIYGVTRDELSFEELKKLAHPDDVEEAVAALEKTMSEGVRYDIVHRIIQMNTGDVRIIHARGEVIPGSSEASGKLVGFVEDITLQKQLEQELKESSEKYTSLIEKLPDIVYIYKREAGAVFWSDSITKILGIPKEAITTDPDIWNDQIHSDEREKVAEMVDQLVPGESFDIEYRINDHRGRLHWFRDRGTARIDHNGDFIIDGIATDITDKKLAEQQLEESEERFRAMFEQSQSPRLIINPEDGRIEAANPAAVKFYGFSRKKLLSMKISDINTLSVKEVMEKMRQATQREAGLFEFRHRLKNGTIRDVLVDSSPIVYAGKTVLFSTIFNISDRVKAEAAKAEAMRELKLAQGIASIGNWSMDPRTGISEWSEEVYRIYERDPALGPIPYKEYPNLYSKDQFAKLDRAISDAAKKGIPYDINLKLELSAYNIKYIHAICKPEKLKDGEGYLLRGTIQDITEDIEILEKLKEREKKLSELNDTKDILLSIIGHDLRSPFNSLVGLSRVLADRHQQMNDQKLEMMLQALHETAGNTYNLVENLLTWASIQRQRIEFDPEAIALHELVSKCVRVFATQSAKKGLTVKNLVSEEMTCKADRNMLELIIRNLLNNAVKYCDFGGEVVVEARRIQKKTKTFTEVSVKDDGVGIAPELLSGLFRVSRDKSTPGTAHETGSGLGLMLCKDFVERHKGELQVESEVGKGSRFYFTLPCS